MKFPWLPIPENEPEPVQFDPEAQLAEHHARVAKFSAEIELEMQEISP